MIQQLDVENFTVFKKAAFEFGSQLNVFIGENGTGKTQILKLIYAVVSMFSKSQELNQPVELMDGSGYSNYDFNLGYERHWGMSDRIDLYAGAMVGYTRYLAFYDDLNVPSGRHKTTDNNGHVSGHYSMGGIFTGLDFYLWKGLYCGAEVGLKVERMKESQSSYTFASPAHTYINAGFYCEPAIRVGWTF